MPAPQDLTIQRSTDLDLGIDELWELVSTAEGWAAWLVDDAEITVATNSTGTATVDETERTVRIDSVVERRSVSFSWWDHQDCDGDRDSAMSHVRLDIVELPDGRSRLEISEQLRALPTASASATASMTTAIRWEVAMVSLWLLALHSLVMA